MGLNKLARNSKKVQVTLSFAEMDTEYDQIMGQIVKVINEADKWLIK